MKKHILFMMTVLIASFSINSEAQVIIRGLKQNWNITLNEKGDAEWDIISRLDKNFWNNYTNNAINRANAQKQYYQKLLPTLFMENFKYEEDPMNFTHTLSVEVPGMTKMDVYGNWVYDFLEKGSDIRKVNESEYEIRSTIAVGTAIVEQTQNIQLPKNVEFSKLATKSDGSDQIIYSLKEDNGGMWRYLSGGLMMLAGLGLIVFTGKKNE